MKNILSTFFCLIILFPARAQFTNILISPTGCTEPSICIDPTNVSRVVAATNCTYSYYSSDTGHTWSSCINSITAGVWCYDPCIIADYSGNFYYFHNFQIAPQPIYVTVQKSFNGGQSWSFDNTVPHLYDKEMACVRPSTNELYTVFIPDSGGFNNVGFSRSADGGVTWTPMSVVNAQSYPAIQWGAAPAVGTAPGELYVVWENSAGVYFQKSYDNGNTWQFNDYHLSTFLNTGNGYNCMPSIATDISAGPHSGNIYITWWELDVNGTDTDIYLATSTDGGANWNITSIASDINTDQKWPQAMVDPTSGYVYVVYYSQVGVSTGYDINMAFSTDGGNSFVNVPVSSSPATVTNWYHHYIGNSAYNGIIRPAWTTNDSLFTALISYSGLNLWLGAQQYEVQAALNIFPNPSTGVYFISSSAPGEIIVVNSTGQVVFKQFITGEQTSFDISNLPGGLYLVTLTTRQGRATQKIIKR
ncbi:MAG: T9SS type A sorting domain-containing protein [Bacteroidia bacterium]|nr:T9SS type A sorting domain-containing protein [Bacteroidia bacterium]